MNGSSTLPPTMRAKHADCGGAHTDRTFAAGQPAGVLRHRRKARRRQDHHAHHVDHGSHRYSSGGGGLVDQRRGTAKGAAVLFPLRRALHSVGQHQTRHTDFVPAYRAQLYRGLLFGSQARRLRNGGDRGLDDTSFHGKQYRAERRPVLAQPAEFISPSIRPIPRTASSFTPTRSIGPKSTAPTFWARSTRSCSAISSCGRHRCRG